jgi:predicted cupin superfamily sugar epimerase
VSSEAAPRRACGEEAESLIAALNLAPHPEGGYFRETFRDANSGRAHSTAILFLLKAGEVSRWHRVDAAEVWHYYRGAPLELTIGKMAQVLGPGIEQGQAPQAVVPKGIWQMARSLGDYTLVGCTVAPGFEFSGFEMAPEGFTPVG